MKAWLAIALAAGGSLLVIVTIVLMARRRKISRDEVISAITQAASIHQVDPALLLTIADLEAGLHADHYNLAARKATAKVKRQHKGSPAIVGEKFYYMYQNVLDKAQESEAFAAKLAENPDRGDPEAWGSYGVFQQHPHFEWKRGMDHTKPNAQLYDVPLNVDLGAFRISNMVKKNATLVDLRLRYLGWPRFAELLEASTPRERRRLETAVTKKIPRLLKYAKRHGCHMQAWGSAQEESEYRRLREELGS